MRSGVPWHVKGVRPQARETAREAARRSGMSVGQWLDTVIIDSAIDEGIEPAHPQPTDQPDDQAPNQIAVAISRLDGRLDQLIAEGRTSTKEIERRLNAVDSAVAMLDRERPTPAPTAPSTPLDQALLEIAERQRALKSGTSLPRSDLPQAPTQNFGGLEQQLREITSRVETLRPCGVDNAIETLRDDLAEIGLMLKEAMPRHVVESLEAEVRLLAERIESQRQAGLDGVAVAGIERGLAEVRDVLRALTPAENLVGFDETVRGLSDKVDRLASNNHNPIAFEQLESAILGLRGIVSHVASNDALTSLSDEVRILAAKVEQTSNTEMLATIEQQIATIADALQSLHPPAQEARQIEAAIQAHFEKIERLQLTRADQTAISHLEDRIVKLVEKLDASDARLGSLEAIERALAELLIHLEHQRIPQPGPAFAAEHPEAATSPQEPIGDRSTIVTTTTPQPSTSYSALANPAARSEHRPIDPSLPHDYPLEPGLGIRGRNGASPADRIAASEAALGPGNSPANLDPGSKSNFIAAARRAAQAANGEAAARDKRAAAPIEGARRGTKQASRLGIRVRSVLVVASIVVIVLGSLQLVFGLIGTRQNADESQPAETTQTAPDTGTTGTAPQFIPSSSNGSPLPSPPSAVTGGQSVLLPGGAPFAAPSSGVLLPSRIARPPADTTPKIPVSTPIEPQVTGSMRAPSLAPSLAPSVATAASRPADSTFPTPAPAGRAAGTDKLPAAMGSAGLRAAATKGDPAAEYEIALRFAEGRGIPQDLSAAVEWFERAAKQGLAPAQTRLGALYEKGQGVKKDIEAARRLYLLAAQAGNAKSMHNLAVIYAEGINGKPDYQNAARWFRKGAEFGIMDSQYNLGILYTRGIGVETNLGEAYKWFALAAREGDKEAAKKRDDIGNRLDQSSLMAARAAVQVWAAEPQIEKATQVQEPAGGWDAAVAPPPAKRASRPRAEAATPRATQ